MAFIKKQNLDFFIKDGRIHLDTKYLQDNRKRFKKITGSRFANVLNMSAYNSPAKTWAIITNIFRDEMDETLAFVGNTVEPKIRDYVQTITGVKYLVYEPAKISWDIFKDDEIFGGIPDGEPLDQNGKIDYSNKPMLEIKTTSIDAFVYKMNNNKLQMQKDSNGTPLIKEKGKKKKSWFDDLGRISVSNEYKMQLGLYLYLRNTTKGLFAIGFLEPEDYVVPELFDPHKREIRLVDFNINRDEMELYINHGRKWYNEHIVTGISPPLSQDDLRWLKNELGEING